MLILGLKVLKPGKWYSEDSATTATEQSFDIFLPCFLQLYDNFDGLHNMHWGYTCMILIPHNAE